jgi:hypothetical protein
MFNKTLDNVLYVLDIDDVIEIIEAKDIFVIPNIGDKVIIDKDSISTNEVEIKEFIDMHGSVYTVEKVREDFHGKEKDELKKWILVFLKPKTL